MSSYYPLLPNINGRDKNKIFGSLTILNFPNNLKKKNYSKLDKKSLFLGVYKIKNKEWELIFTKECFFKNFISINRSELSVTDTEMVVCVLRKINDFPSRCSMLPTPHSLRVDNAFVEERASFNFSYKNQMTSYQGEYPYALAKISKSSFLSFDFLKSYDESNYIQNFLILMNLNLKSDIQSEIDLYFYDPSNKNKRKIVTARRNCISVIDLNLINKSYLNKNLFFYSNEASFIPLFLSVNFNGNFLSFEHTHPPSEIFIGKDRFNANKILKKIWIF